MSNVETRIVQSTTDKLRCSELMQVAYEISGPMIFMQARRLASLRRSTTDWWLLEEDGEAACTLLCYHLLFGTAEGEVVPGFGIGAVGTPPAFRGRGHASALCERVAEHATENDVHVGLLYSAIGAPFYEKLGYRTCEAWDQESKRVGELAESGPRAELVAIDPRAARAQLDGLYSRAHVGRLHLYRDAATWERTLLVEPDDVWLGVGSDPDGELRGYVRLARDEDRVDVIELILDEPEHEASVLRAIAALTVELKREKLAGWLAPTPVVREFFEEKSREKTLPMIRGDVAIDGALFWSSDYF